jgi:ATP-dependent Lon protease
MKTTREIKDTTKEFTEQKKEHKISKDKTNVKIDIGVNPSSDLYAIIQNKTNYIQEIIRKTSISIHYYKNNEIFSNNEDIICISALKELYKKSLDVSKDKTIDENITILQTIVDKLSVVISGFGTESIEDLLYIVFGIEYKNKTFAEDPVYSAKYDLIKRYCHPISYKIINGNGSLNAGKRKITKIPTQPENVSYISSLPSSSFTNNSAVTLTNRITHPVSNSNKISSAEMIANYCNDKITENSVTIENSADLECYDIFYSNPVFQVKIYGIQVVFQNKKLNKTLVVTCITENINLDFIQNNLYIQTQKQKIKDITEEDAANLSGKSKINTTETEMSYYSSRIEKMADCMTLKDILVYGKNDIKKRYIKMETDVFSILQNKLDINIKHFLELDTFLQRELLINLLMYDINEDILYIAYLLYDIININNNQNIFERNRFGDGGSCELADISGIIKQKIIYNSFPYKIKNLFKNAMSITIKYNHSKMSKYDIQRTTLEQQIYLMNVPENIKEKAIAKLKEIKGKTDENSSKAKLFLEGLLKIPFNVYREEPILLIIKDINNAYNRILCNYRLYENGLLNEKKNEKKEKHTVIEIVHRIRNIKQNMRENFQKTISTTIQRSQNKNLVQSIKILPEQLYKIVQENKQEDNANIEYTTFIRERGNQKTKERRIAYLLEFINRFSVLPSTAVISNGNDETAAVEETDVLYFTTMEELQYRIYDNLVVFQYSQLLNELKTLYNKCCSVNDKLQDITKTMDLSIYGHSYAKNQILKLIGQWMSGENTGYCFGFEGSPGVGKTSLAKYGLSRCLQDENGNARPFAFITLGGSSNGSTLEGHNYTYVNSTWGKIVDVIMETKCMNPIIYIDELDKVSKTEQGKEIIGILTHIIDSTQNDAFQDKYFRGIDIDLSKVLFIFSYNNIELIDPILLDRIHRIHFDNLTIDDKIVVANKYILPEINKKMGFQNTVHIEDAALKYIIDSYTCEPGVRKCKEILFDLYGEINLELMKRRTLSVDANHSNEFGDNLATHQFPIKITMENISIIESRYLHKYNKRRDIKIHNESKIGVVNGLWANSYGNGGIIPIEAVFFLSPKMLDLQLTGMQGDVMKESMNVAKNLAWKLTVSDKQNTLCEIFKCTNLQGLHIHCPEGAISKDGPSAGAAITITLYSLFNSLKISNTVGITGEINLQGSITAIGGLDLKINGGIKAGIQTFYFPKENHCDFAKFEEKNRELCKNIQFVEIETIEELIAKIFVSTGAVHEESK